MFKNVIIIMLSLLLLVVVLLDSDFLSARFGLLQNSKQEYIRDKFMCGDFTKGAIEVLESKNIKSYIGIIEDGQEFHAFNLIAFDPENNRFYSPEELNKLVDICEINENIECLKGNLNDELNYYYQ